jgi:uncharacterized integral membrane protein
MSEGARSFKEKSRLIIAAVLAGVLVLFALQNLARVELNVLFWSFEARRIVVIGFSFAIGFAIGWLVRAHRTRRPARQG